MTPAELLGLLELHQDDLGLVLTVSEQFEATEAVISVLEHLAEEGRLTAVSPEKVIRWRKMLEELKSEREALRKAPKPEDL